MALLINQLLSKQSCIVGLSPALFTFTTANNKIQDFFITSNPGISFNKSLAWGRGNCISVRSYYGKKFRLPN